MKDFKKKVTRPRKRVIAILLSLLMVLSIVIPSGGSGVRYNAYAEGEESALGEGVDITSEEETTEETTEEDISATSEEASSATEDITNSTTEETTDGTTSEKEDGLVEDESLLGGANTEDEGIVDGESRLGDGVTVSTELVEYVYDAGLDNKYSGDPAIDKTSENVWGNIDLSKDYKFTIYFTENQLRQFIDDARTMTYVIPEGIVIDTASISDTITLEYKADSSSTTETVSGNPVSINGRTLNFSFNTEHVNFQNLKNSNNAEFHLSFYGKFDGTKTEFNFGNGINKSIVTANQNDVSVEKTQSGTLADNGKLTYSVTVSSTGYNTGINLTDIIDNNNFKIENVRISGISDVDLRVTANSISDDKINYDISYMNNGEKIVFTYDVAVKDSASFTDPNGNFTIGNDAKVTCGTDTDSTNNEKSVSKTMKYVSISSKSAKNANNETGEVEWEIVLNKECIASLNNVELTDVLSEEYNNYVEDSIEIKKYDKNGTQQGSTVTPTAPAGQTFTYNFTDDQPYYYVITYKTKVNNYNSFIKNVNVNNTVSLGNYDTKTGSNEFTIPDVNKYTFSKKYTAISDDYIEWEIEVNVPAVGFTDGFQVTDSLTGKWLNGVQYFDSIPEKINNEENIKVEGLLSGETFRVSSYEDASVNGTNAHIGFTLNFKKSNGTNGLDSNTSNRTLKIKFKTETNKTWVQNSKGQTTDFKSHTNSASGTANDITLNGSDTVIPSISEISKSFKEQKFIEIENVSYPVFSFVIHPTPVEEEQITITDTLPDDFIIYEEGDGAWTKKTQVSNVSWNIDNNEAESKYGTVTTSQTDNTVTFTLNVKKDSNDAFYNDYYLIYYIRPKNEEALKKYDKLAIENDGTYTLSNDASFNGETATVNFNYVPQKNNDAVVNKEELSVNNGVANFRIDINPYEYELNHGDQITLTDTFSNLSIDYSSIVIKEVDDSGNETVATDVKCNVSGSVMTAVLKDKTHYRINYTSKILRIGEYSNVASLKGFTSELKENNDYESGGSYSNNASIRIFKQEKGDVLTKLSGVKFLLFTKNDSGEFEPVLFETGEHTGEQAYSVTDDNGIAEFKSGDGYSFETDKTYYFSETDTPDGYVGIDGKYQFTIKAETNWALFQYQNGETMRVDNSKKDLVITKTLQGAPDDEELLSTVSLNVQYYKGEGDDSTLTEETVTLKDIKDGIGTKARYDYDPNTNTYIWYITDITTGTDAKVKEIISTTEEKYTPKTISYTVSGGSSTSSNSNYTSGSEVTVSDLAENDEIKTVAFTNSYSNNVEVIPTVYKKLDGNTLGSGNDITFPLDGLSFGFTLYDLKSDLYSSNHTTQVDDDVLKNSSSWDTSASKSATASDSTDGAAIFDKITYEVEGASTFPQYYYYKIVEDDSTYTGINDDDGYIIMIVKIIKDASGKIDKEVTYTKYESNGTEEVAATPDSKTATFNNTSEGTELQLYAKKFISENNVKTAVTTADLFSFKLEPVEPGASDSFKKDEHNTSQNEKKNDATGKITFDELTYSGSDISLDSSKPTIYRYKLSENDVTDTSYVKDTNYYLVDVKVTRDSTTKGVKAEIDKITKYTANDVKIIDVAGLDNVEFVNDKATKTGTYNLSAKKLINNSDSGVNGTNYAEFKFCCKYLGEKTSSLQPDKLTPDKLNAIGSNTEYEANLADSTNVATFATITYSSANGSNDEFGLGNHIYYIYEDEAAGYTGIKNTKDYYIVEVPVTDSGSGTTLTVGTPSVYKYSYNEDTDTYTVSGATNTIDDVIFDNNIKSVPLELNATKEITDYSKNGFTFIIESVVPSGISGVTRYDFGGGSYTKTAVTDNNGNAAFPTMTFSSEGTYYFNITEKDESTSNSNLNYDKSEYQVVVVVSKDAVGKGLKVEKTITKIKDTDGNDANESSDNIVFANSVKPDMGSIKFEAQKKLKKADGNVTTEIKDGNGNLKQFSFTLEEVDSTGASLSTPNIIQIDAVNTVNGKVSFNTITYDDTQIGTYYYKITENSVDNDYAYKYDDTIYFVKVTVSHDTNTNTIVATPEYHKGTVNGETVSSDEVIFTNEEKYMGITLNAKKVLNGIDFTNYSGNTDGFHFVAVDSNNAIVGNGYNDVNGDVSIAIAGPFGPFDIIKTTGINDSVDNPYVYTIYEDSTGKTDDFICSDARYQVKVWFRPDATDGIKAEIKYYDSTGTTEITDINEVKFENTKKYNADIEITAKKLLEDAAPGTIKFEFGLYQGDTATGTPLQIKQNDANGIIRFDKIEYDQSDFDDATDTEKTFTYTVAEIIPDVMPLPGYNYDTEKYKVEVTLTRNLTTGVINVTHKITKSSDTSNPVEGNGDIAQDSSNNYIIHFDNTYKTTSRSWPLSVKKQLANNNTVDKKFSFELYSCTDSSFAYDASSPIDTKETNDVGVAVFGDNHITYNNGTESNYYFVVKEKNTGDDLVNYSDKEYKLTVHVDTAGNVTVKDDENNTYESGQITFTNSIDVKVAKQNSSGAYLSGATLKVMNGSTVFKDSFTTGNEPETLSGITVDTVYTLKEVEAPIGYETAEDIYFRVKYDTANSVYKLETSSDGTTWTDSTEATVVMTDEKKDFVINKKSSNGEYLVGAELKIVDPDNENTPKDSWTTTADENHSFDLSELTKDKYYKLVETKSPFGYKLADSIEFKITSENKIIRKQADGSEAEIPKDSDGKYYLTMTDEPLELIVEKYEEGAGAPMVAPAVNGTKFKIEVSDSNGNPSTLVRELTIGAQGKYTISISNLGLNVNQEYLLTETVAPSGYEKAAPLMFKIDEDNKLWTKQIGGTYSQADNLTIKVYDKPADIILISKIDPENPTVELQGAKLTIIDEEGHVLRPEFVTTGNPVEISTNELVKNRIYILRENSVPAGSGSDVEYYKAEDIQFKIDADNKLYVKTSNDTAFVEQTGNNAHKVVMKDEARKFVKISKVDITNSRELPNARLEITDINHNVIKEKKTDDTGKLVQGDDLIHTSQNVPWEIDYKSFDIDTEYIFTEITAPAGYEKAESIHFRLHKVGDDTIVQIKNSNGDWDDVSDLSLTMRDEPVNRIRFRKLDDFGDLLDGAHLAIYKVEGGQISGTVFDEWDTEASGSNPREYLLSRFLSGTETEATYILREIDAPDGYKLAKDIKFVVRKITTGTAPEESTSHKIYIINEDGSESEVSSNNYISFVDMVDNRDYSVKISKWDITHDKELPGAVIEILDEAGNVVTDEAGNDLKWTSDTAAKEIHGLRPGVTYTLREVVAPDGFRIATDTVFELNNDGTINTDKTTTKISSAGVLLVEDSITSLNFTKYGLVNEACAPDPAAYEPLEGVEFAAYKIADDGTVEDTATMTAISNASGTVIFNQLSKGKYEIREIKSVEPFIESEEVYYAVVDDKDFAGLTDKDGNKIFGNRVINDQYRTDIVFTKVSERNKAKKLAGSTYGLYKKDSVGKENLITTTVSDKDGVVRFKGVLTGTKYVIRELESPEGYYVSENPIEISFKLDGEDVVRATLNDGSGTIVLGANGEITWLEPSVVVNFLKVDENNNPLPGATLAILNMDGSPVKDAEGKEIKWVSTSEAYEVADVFEDGVSYQLVELAAPEGYVVAEPIIFKIPDEKVGVEENKVISVTMIDRLTTTVTPPEKTTPPSVKTGDTAPIKPVTSMMFISLAGIIYLLILGRRRKDILR